MSNKYLIYQVFLGKERHSNLYQFCIDSVTRYCKKYSIDHIIQSEPILKILPDLSCTNRSVESYMKHACDEAPNGFLPIYEKENAFLYLDQYDKIAIIDADVYIRDEAPNIFNELNRTFGAVVEREMPLIEQYKEKIKTYSIGQYGPLKQLNWKWNDLGAEFFNMGVMVFNKDLLNYLNNETPKQFISRLEFKQFVDGIGNYKWSTDQTLLNYFIKKYNIPVIHLNWRWNALYKAVEDHKIPSSYFIHFFLKDLLHNKGEDLSSIKNILGLNHDKI